MSVRPWHKCEFCRKRGHGAEECPQILYAPPPTDEDLATYERIKEKLFQDPKFQEERNRRRAHKHFGTDPDAKPPRWKRFRR